MESTLWRAGRTTHLKIVAVALVAAITVVAVGINAKIGDVETSYMAKDGTIVRASDPPTYANKKTSTIR